MIVISLNDCPPKIRGDLSKWLCEISPGVYVGNLSARVRDELWKRVCDNLKNGRATMVYNAQGEQQLKFEVHNTHWKPVDFDGITLMRRPLPGGYSTDIPKEAVKSRAGKMLMAKRTQSAKMRGLDEYVVIDVETTGLCPERDRIIEIGALLIKNGTTSNEFQALIRQDLSIPNEIVHLTGITNDMLLSDGVSLRDALMQLADFVANRPIVCHNANFDCGFLNHAARLCGVNLFRSTCTDTLLLARRRIRDVNQYSLEHLSKHFGFDTSQLHRAIPDCKLTFALFKKLNEI